MFNVYAIIADGTVLNLIVWDGAADWQLPEGAVSIQVSDGTPVSIGDTYDGASFHRVPVPPKLD
jgi:hypothetical protein